MIKKYTNYPKKISYNYYNEARNELIGSLKENIDIHSIYEYGSISVPGGSGLNHFQKKFYTFFQKYHPTLYHSLIFFEL